MISSSTRYNITNKKIEYQTFSDGQGDLVRIDTGKSYLFGSYMVNFAELERPKSIKPLGRETISHVSFALE